MLDKNKIPKHIAIIMDGNGRWAQRRGLPRLAGHRVGMKRVKEIVKCASDLGVKAVTFFAFSTENWQRPKREVDMLMRAFIAYLNKEIKGLIKNNIRFKVIGRERPLSSNLLAKIRQAEHLTAGNSGLTVVLALNYGGRSEIIDAARKFAMLVSNKDCKINQLDEEMFSKLLYAPNLPEPELFIRTSGELRISNFLLWQLAYTELYFPEKYWPAFTRDDLIKAIIEYQDRHRRFGGLK